MNDDGGVIGNVDGGNHAVAATLRGTIGGIQDKVECSLDVGGRNDAAVMKADAAAEVEDVGERVGRVPGFGEIAVEIHLIVALEEAAEEQAIDFLRLRVGGKAGIEISGIGFDEECDRRGKGIQAARAT